MLYMLEVAKNKTSRSTPDEQLYWFVNKVLSIERITYLPFGEYDELICFQPNLLKESEFFKFRICTYDPGATDGGIRENRTLIGIMLMKIKSDVEGNIEKFRKDYGLPSDIEYLIWDDESILLDDAIYIYRKCRPVFEAYRRYLDGDKIETEIVLQKKRKKQIQAPLLPSNLKWGEIMIKFLNGDEVQITAKELVYQTNYELMGFQDQKTKNPNLQWKFFKMLSLKNGYLNWDNNQELTTKARNNVKKQKQGLSETLKTYFAIKDDPFFDYKKENGYKIKIQLIPEQGSDIKDTMKTASRNIDNYDEDIDPDTQDFFNAQIEI